MKSYDRYSKRAQALVHPHLAAEDVGNQLRREQLMEELAAADAALEEAGSPLRSKSPSSSRSSGNGPGPSVWRRRLQAIAQNPITRTGDSTGSDDDDRTSGGSATDETGPRGQTPTPEANHEREGQAGEDQQSAKVAQMLQSRSQKKEKKKKKKKKKPEIQGTTLHPALQPI